LIFIFNPINGFITGTPITGSDATYFIIATYNTTPRFLTYETDTQEIKDLKEANQTLENQMMTMTFDLAMVERTMKDLKDDLNHTIKQNELCGQQWTQLIRLLPPANDSMSQKHQEYKHARNLLVVTQQYCVIRIMVQELKSNVQNVTSVNQETIDNVKGIHNGAQLIRKVLNQFQNGAILPPIPRALKMQLLHCDQVEKMSTNTTQIQRLIDSATTWFQNVERNVASLPINPTASVSSSTSSVNTYPSSHTDLTASSFLPQPNT
jgi:hypothetical protein